MPQYRSSTAGPPKGIGTVASYEGSTLLGSVPVSAAGTATLPSLPASSFSNGSHTFIASYSGGTNYSAGSSSAVVTVAVK